MTVRNCSPFLATLVVLRGTKENTTCLSIVLWSDSSKHCRGRLLFLLLAVAVISICCKLVLRIFRRSDNYVSILQTRPLCVECIVKSCLSSLLINLALQRTASNDALRLLLNNAHCLLAMLGWKYFSIFIWNSIITIVCIVACLNWVAVRFFIKICGFNIVLILRLTGWFIFFIFWLLTFFLNRCSLNSSSLRAIFLCSLISKVLIWWAVERFALYLIIKGHSFRALYVSFN